MLSKEQVSYAVNYAFIFSFEPGPRRRHSGGQSPLGPVSLFGAAMWWAIECPAWAGLETSSSPAVGARRLVPEALRIVTHGSWPPSRPGFKRTSCARRGNEKARAGSIDRSRRGAGASSWQLSRLIFEPVVPRHGATFSDGGGGCVPRRRAPTHRGPGRPCRRPPDGG